jgi:hypothetical protein
MTAIFWALFDLDEEKLREENQKWISRLQRSIRSNFIGSPWGRIRSGEENRPELFLEFHKVAVLMKY